MPTVTYSFVTTWGTLDFLDTWAGLGTTEATRRFNEVKFVHEYPKSQIEFTEGMRAQYLYPAD